MAETSEGENLDSAIKNTDKLRNDVNQFATRKHHPSRGFFSGRYDRFGLISKTANLGIAAGLISSGYAGYDQFINSPPLHRGAVSSDDVPRDAAIARGLHPQAYANEDGNPTKAYIYENGLMIVSKSKSNEKPNPPVSGVDTEYFNEFTKEKLDRVMQIVPDNMKEAAKDTIPLVVRALSEYEMNETEVIAYALATVEHESLFEVREEIDGPEQAEKYNYSGGKNYFGRGMIMLTHDYNYEKYGKKLDIDLKNQPWLALEPEIAARIFALWFRDEGTADYARKLDYVHARKTINPEEFNMEDEPFKSTPYEIADRAWQYMDALLGNKPSETRQDIIDEIIKNVDEQFNKLKINR